MPMKAVTAGLTPGIPFKVPVSIFTVFGKMAAWSGAAPIPQQIRIIEAKLVRLTVEAREGIFLDIISQSSDRRESIAWFERFQKSGLNLGLHIHGDVIVLARDRLEDRPLDHALDARIAGRCKIGPHPHG